MYLSLIHIYHLETYGKVIKKVSSYCESLYIYIIFLFCIYRVALPQSITKESIESTTLLPSTSTSGSLKLPATFPSSTERHEEISFTLHEQSAFQEHIDPSIYSNKKIQSEDIEPALKLEHQKLQSTFQFPSHNSRKFSLKWRNYELPDGTVKER